jgi:DNA polymerase-3 subunit delta
MLHVFYGADEFRSSEALAELHTSLNGDGMLANNTSVLAGRGLTPATLTQHAMAVPFLAESRLVVVEGLMSALGSRRGVADEWQPLIDELPQLPPSNHVALIEPAPKRDDRSGVSRSPLLRALKNVPDAEIREFAELKTWNRNGPSEVGRWLYDRASARGIAIESEAIDPLVDLIGANLRALAQELEKLAAYASATTASSAAPDSSAATSGGRPITAADVQLLTPQAREESMFALVDAIVEGRADLALRLLRRVLDDGSIAPTLLQVMVARQLRHLIRGTELLERHTTEAEIAETTGLSGFPLTKMMRQARQTNRTAVEASLHDLEAADFAVKSGRMNDELALELVVCRLASHSPFGGSSTHS